MRFEIAPGSTSVIRHVRIRDSVTGAAKTALLFSDITAKYVKDGGSLTSLTMETIATLGIWASSGAGYLGFKKLDDTNMPGWYEIDLPNNLLASAGRVSLELRATGAEASVVEIDLRDIATQTTALATKAKTDLLPSVAAGASGGLTLKYLRSLGTLIEATNKQTTRNTGLGVPDTGRTFLMGGNRMRISHPGKVEWITYYVWEKTGVTTIIPRVFRYNGSTWDQVGSDGDTITGPWSTNDTWYTHTLASPIEGVRAGDCLALYAIATPTQFDFFGAVNGLDADDFDLLYAESNITGSAQTFGLSVASTAPMGTCKIQSPVIALAGDSFAAGKDVSNSFLAPQEIAGNWKAVAAANGIAGELYTLDSIFATINCGLGSTTALNWETYFATYVQPKYPKVCIWSLGANDYALRGGQAARGIFLTSLRNVFGLCRDNGILPVMLTILHTSDATLDYKFGWNAQIKKLCAELNVPVIDGFKILADPQNELQRSSRYGTGTHPNAAGYKALAAAIAPTLLGMT